MNLRTTPINASIALTPRPLSLRSNLRAGTATSRPRSGLLGTTYGGDGVHTLVCGDGCD